MRTWRVLLPALVQAHVYEHEHSHLRPAVKGVGLHPGAHGHGERCCEGARQVSLRARSFPKRVFAPPSAESTMWTTTDRHSTNSDTLLHSVKWLCSEGTNARRHGCDYTYICMSCVWSRVIQTFTDLQGSVLSSARTVETSLITNSPSDSFTAYYSTWDCVGFQFHWIRIDSGCDITIIGT